MTMSVGSSFHLLNLFSSLLVLAEGRESSNSSTKPHYTDFHQGLHRLVRQTTHSHLKDFEIVIPEFPQEFGGQNGRKRRHISPKDYRQRIKVSSHGHEFDVELNPNPRLLSEKFAVEHVKDGKRRDLEELEDEFDCHHTGRMISHDNLTTAISTCRGLSGLLRTAEDDYIIEPVPSHLLEDFVDSKPHIVYKTKDLNQDQEGFVCGKQRHNPIPTAIEGYLDIKELSNGELIFARDDEESREELLSRRRHKRGDPNRRTRSKRKIVETLVVADHHVVRKHVWSIPDVTSYVLTIMNMVSSLFKDASLDDQVDIVVVGLIILEDDTAFELNHKADKSLANFCRWQSKLNMTTGRRPDHSILLTGADICVDKNAPCDTLGLAQIGGMCTRASCTINEDSGLGVAFTVAHETGHSFGMKHDGQGNSCSENGGYLMSPKLRTTNGVFTWSSCSRKAMAKFLRSHRSRCLDDEPGTVNVKFPEELPGQQYNGNLQCQLQYGADSQLCVPRYVMDQEAICKAIWCMVGMSGICRTKGMPAAEGTDCGTNKWCRRGQCVPRGTPGPTPVDGGWSGYGGWSKCSRTCGRGVSFKRRFCNNPAPLYGGRHCGGEDKMYRICNPQECPPDSQSFRAQQCARYNTQAYRRQYFSWVPFTKFWKYDFNRCELYCEAEGYGFFDRLSAKVFDGTACDEENNDVCIDGQCERVGCDYILNSNAKLDACGVCNGHNSTCNFITGNFTDDVESGYHVVVTIPAGARTVRVWERHCCTRAFIVARSATNRSRYFLNGNWRVDRNGIHKFAGARWSYERPSDQGDILSTKGPLAEDVVIEILLVQRNPGVSYIYAMESIENTLPHDPVDNRPRSSYSWEQRFSTCSKSCGGGFQRSSSICVEDGNGRVISSYCERSKRPRSRTRKCNTQLCPPRWVAKEWGTCSRTCGGGVQTRSISCQRPSQEMNIDADLAECNQSPAPKTSRPCGVNLCPPKWVAADWSKCSRTCGRGVQTRMVYCKSGTKRVASAKCLSDDRPANRQACSVAACITRFLWTLSDWSSCSTTCGQGRRYRTLKCVYRATRGRLRPISPVRCRAIRKPRATLQKSCSLSACSPSRERSRPRGTASVAKKPRIVTMRTSRRPAPRRTPAPTRYRVPFRRPLRTTKPPAKRRKPVGPRTTARPRQAATTTASRRIAARRPKGQWISSAWQACTRTCGGGRQVRAVKCMANGRPSTSCTYSNKPPNIRSCNSVSCLRRNNPCEDQHDWCHMAPLSDSCSVAFFSGQCCKSCRDGAKSNIP